ncbi:APC family permease [Pseudomonas japonica]|uniref:APC family permease n=1 Tax=Pseudomonas japonica TaxID=256466 RepID=UPI0037FC0EC3
MSTEHNARRKLGAGSLFFFVVAAAAPLTTMAAFAPLAFLLGGVVTPLGFAIAGLVYLLFAAGFLALVRHHPQGGAFYSYISLGLGQHIGVGAAMVAYVAYALGQIGFCAVAGVFTHEALLAVTGVDVSWGACAATMALIAGGLAYCRIELNALVMGVLIIAEIGILALFSGVVLLQGGAEGIDVHSFDPVALLKPGVGSLLVVSFLVFIGFEQTALYSDEAKDPKRTVSRATYMAICFLTLFYLLTSWSIYLAIGPSAFESALQGDTANLVFELAARYLGGFASSVMLVLVVTSFFAGVLAFHNASARYLLTIAEDGMLHRSFASRNRFGMPKVSGIFQALLVTAVIIISVIAEIDPYRQLIVWTNTPTVIGILLLQVITSFSVIRYFATQPTAENLWRRLIAPASAALVLSAVLYLLLRDLPHLTKLGPAQNLMIASSVVIAFAAGFLRSLMARAPQGSKSSSFI